jgi:protease IV
MPEIPPVYIVKNKKSVWPKVLAGVLFLSLAGALLVSLIANAVLIGQRGQAAVKAGQDRFSETVLEGEGEAKIVLIPIRGLITFSEGRSFWERESMGKQAVERLRAAGEDPAVKGVVLLIDSPGGGITASDIIYHRVKELAESGKVVVAAFEDLAASGGYYVACPADWIVAHPTTITGSIGVIIQTLNLEGLMGKIGIRDVTIKRGEEKDILSPFRDLTAAEREMLEGVIDEMYGRFLSVVSEGRHLEGDRLEAVAGGAIFTGTQALANDLVDEIGYRDTAIARARELAGLEEATVIEYRRVYSFFDLFRGRLEEALPPAAGFDLQSLLKPSTPRLLYLWTL